MSSSSPLADLLRTFPSLLIGYSGGVDSALLAVVARRVLGRERSAAAIGVSASLSETQYRQALGVAGMFDVRVIEVPTGEVGDTRYAANTPSRCYFCKHELWKQLEHVAARHEFSCIVDGTNSDDLDDHRPGSKAAAEHGIRSPLVEAGYTKAHIRREARALGIPVWDAPAAPCLASRVMYGLSVTPTRLRQVENGEAVLRSIGVTGDLRVRHRGQEARLEVAPSEFPLVRLYQCRIRDRFLLLGFSRVTLDLDGYRRGKLLGGGESSVELLAERA